VSKRYELTTFLVPTFGLTYLIQYYALTKGDIMNGGYQGGLTPELTVAFQLVMYIPALVAIVLNRFVIKKDLYSGKAVWFINYYLLLTAEMLISFIAITVLGLHTTNPIILPIIGSVTALTGLTGTILLFALNLKPKWRTDLGKAKLSLGNIRHYLVYGGFLALFLTIGAILDQYTGLGYNPNTDPTTLITGAFNALILAPVLGLTTGVFGEEYGWRIYLQDLLVERYGKRYGVGLLGIIWGLWHAPVVLAGWTYPGYGFTGLLVFIVFATILGTLLSHATFASGTVWVAAFVHAINNGYGNFTLNLVTFYDPVYNFRLGIYGLSILAVLIFGIILSEKKLWTST